MHSAPSTTTPTLKAVDKLAKSAAGQAWEVDRGFRPGKVGKSKLGGKVASTLFPAAGQQSRVRIYRTELSEEVMTR